MEIQMIAIDLDGTALQPDHVTVSSGLRETLEEASQRGILVVPVTGRPFRLLPPLFLDHPRWESYGILCNGAEIRNLRTGEILLNHSVDQYLLTRILDVAERYGLPAEFNSDGRLYLTEQDFLREQREPKLEFHCKSYIPNHGVFVENLRECCDLSVEKVHINCIPAEKWTAVEKELSVLPINVVCEKPPNLELTHQKATKGKSLRKLCESLGISTEKVMALGDSGNDLTLLETAGFSVAMGNAPAFLKEKASFVAGTNTEDGAAGAIRRFAF